MQNDPAEAGGWAEIAQTVARRIREGGHFTSAGTSKALNGLALAYLGNARRAVGELAEAAGLFRMVRRKLALDTPSWILAEILSLQGSLLKDLRQMTEARGIFERAHHHFKIAGDTIAAGKVQLNLAATAKHEGNPDRAVHLTAAALQYFNPESEPRLYLWAHHNLASYLLEAGEVDAAHDLLTLLHPLYDQFEDSKPKIRRRWLEGLIARESAQPELAEECLTAVIEFFAAEGAAFYAALAALDLALLLWDEGRDSELAGLASRLPPIFEAQNVQREAAAAATLFHQAAVRNGVSRQFLVALRKFFEHARADRAASFQPPIDAG